MRISIPGELGTFFDHLETESKKVEELKNFASMIGHNQTVIIEVDKRDHQKIKSVEVIEGKWWQRSCKIALRRLRPGRTYHYKKSDIYRDLASYLDWLTEEVGSLNEGVNVNPELYQSHYKYLKRLKQNVQDIAQRMFNTDRRGRDLIRKVQGLIVAFHERVHKPLIARDLIEEGADILEEERASPPAASPTEEVVEDEKIALSGSGAFRDDEIVEEDEEEAIKPEKRHYLGREDEEDRMEDLDDDNRPDASSIASEESDNIPFGNEPAVLGGADVASIEDIHEKDQKEWTPVDDLRYLCEERLVMPTRDREWYENLPGEDMTREVMKHVRNKERGQKKPVLAHNAMVALLETKSPQKSRYKETFDHFFKEYFRDSQYDEGVGWRLILAQMITEMCRLRDK